ncbi:hypothetical protein ThidrDRAFT_0256 [Thiorhodococcus drewsii AZ1]|uniref:DUF4384 domain-containing protein n=1 Tax=Thiorhodococcus drewsii AZ1 TaxID=765913 RepID=G2DVT6_9GAMM|nr:hypothetical protein [Thiorhodococcus drewsii]EGV34101.1 hypothetical protein ThidrDRAFT_0256 [Thiorhodococcus drewsii AZ1]
MNNTIIALTSLALVVGCSNSQGVTDGDAEKAAGSSVAIQQLPSDMCERPALKVREVRGRTLILDAGRLAGVTVGSLYLSSTNGVRVRIRETGATWSRGEIESGSVGVGTLLVEHRHVYETLPLRLFVMPVSGVDDQRWKEELGSRLGRVPGYRWTNSRADADLLLALVSPRRTEAVIQDCEGQRKHDRRSVEDSAVASELRVLMPDERLLHEGFVISPASGQDEWERLALSLTRYRHLIELRRLVSDAKGRAEVKVSLIQFERCDPQLDGAFRLPATGDWYRRLPGILPMEQLGAHSWPQGTLMSFVLESSAPGDRYVSLIELAANGAVRPIFPLPADDRYLKGGGRVDLTAQDIGLLFDEPGDNSLLILVTREALDPRLMSQEGYGQRRGPSNPGGPGLGRFASVLEATMQDLGTVGWAGRLIDYHVDPVGTRHADLR